MRQNRLQACNSGLLIRPAGRPTGSVVLVFWLITIVAATIQAAEPAVTAIVFAPQGDAVVTGSENGIAVYDWPKLQFQRKIETQMVQVHDLAFAPNGEWLACAGGAPAEVGTWELSDWPAGKLVHRQSDHDDVIYSVAWQPDSQALATGSLDRQTQIHRVPTGEITFAVAGHSRGVTSVAFLAAGDVLITAGLDQSVRVWDIAEQGIRRTFDNHTQPVHCVRERPGQDKNSLPMIVSVSDDRTVRLWQPTIGRMVRFARLDAIPLDVAWTPDGRLLAVACNDGAVRIIDPDTVDILQSTPAIQGWAYCLAVHPKGKEVVVGGAGGQVVRVQIER